MQVSLVMGVFGFRRPRNFKLASLPSSGSCEALEELRAAECELDVAARPSASVSPPTPAAQPAEATASPSERSTEPSSSIGAPSYASVLPPAHLRVGFSLVDELNVRIHWRNAQRRLLALAGESLAHDAPLARRLQRIDAAVQEFEVYRKWVLACAAPPLAFSGRVDRDEVIAQMIKWVARVDSVVPEALAPPVHV